MKSFIGDVSFIQLVLSLVAVFIIHGICRAIYNIFFGPLAKFPGPILRGGFFFPNAYEIVTGDIPTNWHKLHEKYGDIVRISPYTLSFIKPDAWRDIYGYGNTLPVPKDPDFYFRYNKNDPVDIISANNADHARIRRPLNAAFSEQALRNQEGIINSYITLMIEKLHTRAKSHTPVDIMRWLNYTTFDITGDLAFDESFDSLKNEDYNSWIANLFNMLRVGSIMGVIRAYPMVGQPLRMLVKNMPRLVRARDMHANYTKEKTAKRLAKKTDRKDFISYIRKNNDENGMTDAEIKQTSGLLIIAGSETTATLLSGAVFYLCKNPSWITKLHEELRSSFTKESDITFAPLSQIKILNAILYETFRLYPPVPTSLPRKVPEQGVTVCDRFIPPGTKIGIAQYPAYRSSRHFKNSHSYHPERFLGDEEYADDKRSVIQPFSVGPRNCLGRNLAWAEIRSMLARLVWHFEIELLDESSDWEKQKVFILWAKPSLMVKLTARGS